MIQIKRIYDKSEPKDGYRILIDRLWPRGMSKEKAKVDLWLKDIAPSDQLRRWFSHESEKWEEFKKKYQEELRQKEVLIKEIKQLEEEKSVVTLLFAAKDEEHNNAVILKELL